jgi:glutaredoxin-related protein
LPTAIAGYRRIVAEVEERHQIGRKFLERCGFQCEAVLRKHKVLHQRNSNTALYTVLNSDFLEVEKRLKTYLGWSLAPKMHKIAEVESGSGVKGEAVGEVGKGGTGGSSKKNEKKKSKRKSNRANITW